MDREQLHELMKDDQPSRDERNLAMLSHLLPFLGFIMPGMNILIPLLIWLTKRDSSGYVEHHARESLNFQITYTLLAAVWVGLKLMLVGFLLLPLVPVVILFVVIFMVRAGLKASEGNEYRYPLTIRLVN